MQNVTGQVVRGDDFFDRGKDIAGFWDGLKTDNLLLLAPRRVGKSSVLREMENKAHAWGYTAVFVDVSDCGDELHFVQRLYTAILAHHRSSERLWGWINNSWLGETISKVQKIDVTGVGGIQFKDDESRWADMGEELAEGLQKLDGKTLLQIDELPVFLLKLLNRADDTGQGRVREFLYWLRRLRQAYPQVRWMLTGSIGLDTITSRLNIADAINDLRIVSLGAFDRPTSHRFLKALAENYEIELEEPVREHMLNRLGWLVPYYQQLLFDEVRKHKRPSIANVDYAMDDLLKPKNKTRFDYWRQRLFDELGRPDADYALSLLSAVSRDPNGVSRSILSQILSKPISDPDIREDKLRYLLDVLESDGYLVQANHRWSFQSPLLREYWLQRVAPPVSSHE